MRLTNRQLLESIFALQEIGALKLAPATAFQMSRTLRMANTAIEDYNATLNKIIGPPNGVSREESVKAHQKEVDELLACEVDLDAKPIFISDLRGDVQPFTLLRLDWLIRDVPVAEKE